MDKDGIKRLNFLLEIYVDVNVDKDFSVLSKSTDPFFILNMSGQLVYVNEVCEELLQCSRNDLVGMKLSNNFISSVLNDTQTFFSKKQREGLSYIIKEYKGSFPSKESKVMTDQKKEEYISSYISKLLRKKFVRGPQSCQTTVSKNYLVTYIRGFLSLMEDILLEYGQTSTLNMRETLLSPTFSMK